MITGVDLQHHAVTAARLTTRLRTMPDPNTCGTCRGRGQVIESRSYPGYRRRRHVCAACGRRWTTFESFLDPRRVIERPRR